MKTLEAKIGAVTYLTIKQCADMLNCCEAKVRQLIRSGRLQAFRLGGRKASFRISSEALARFVSGSESSADNTTATAGTR